MYLSMYLYYCVARKIKKNFVHGCKTANQPQIFFVIVIIVASFCERENVWEGLLILLLFVYIVYSSYIYRCRDQNYNGASQNSINGTFKVEGTK